MKKQTFTALIFLMFAMVATINYCADIKIRDLMGKIYTVNAEKTDTIGKIRELINQQEPTLNNNFRLVIFDAPGAPKPRVALDEETVEALGLHNEGRLTLRRTGN